MPDDQSFSSDGREGTEVPTTADTPAEARPFKEGVFYDMPADEYHAIEAMSQSGAKEMRRSAAHYRWARDHPKEPTETMQIGTLLHTAILEPDKFEDQAIVMPENAPRRPTKLQLNAKQPSKETVEAINWWREFDERASGKIVIDAETRDMLMHMRDAVLRHDGARLLLENAKREVSLFWIDGKYKVPCKARLDAIDEDLFVVVDLKSTNDASAEEFGTTLANYAYHAQAAHYIGGCEHVYHRTPSFVFIAVEREPPYGVACYAMQSNQILVGGRLMDRAYEAYAEALRTGYWASYSKKIQAAQMPGWALKLPF